MFPILQVQVSGLNPKEMYSIVLEMVPISTLRFKYSSSSGWTPSGVVEADISARQYVHPDSPSSGEYWMSQPINFKTLKLTNVSSPPVGQIVLSSMHRYQPRIFVSHMPDAGYINWTPCRSFTFPETQFIAVTAYQNERITKLKIDYNPFAKGFRENGQSKRKKTEVQDNHKKRNTKRTSNDKEDGGQISPVVVNRQTPPAFLINQMESTEKNEPGTIPSASSYSVSSIRDFNLQYGYHWPYYPHWYYFQPDFRSIHTLYHSHRTFPTLANCSSSYLLQKPYAQYLSRHRPPSPKKITDFSIRNIIGCS